jgi:hypothetical protein
MRFFRNLLFKIKPWDLMALGLKLLAHVLFCEK